MTKQRIIRQLAAGFLLALFALSVTPKLVVHALAANHRDLHLQFAQDDNAQLNQAGFHCNTEHTVVEVPFLFSAPDIDLQTPRCFAHYLSAPDRRIYKSDPVTPSLRGPPSA